MNTKYDIQHLKQLATSCESRVQFKKKYPYLYKVISSNKWFDIVFSDLVNRSQKIWDKQTIQEFITKNNITTIKDWKIKSQTSYSVAVKNKYLKELIKTNNIKKCKLANNENKINEFNWLCKSCNVIKDFNSFYLTKNNKVRNSTCIKCCNLNKKQDRKNNPNKYKKYDNKRYSQHKFMRNFVTRFRNIVKTKSGSFSQLMVEFVGCSKIEMMEHLEKQFKPGMTWDNYSFYGWHIDHIKPLSSFKLVNDDGSINNEQCKIAFNYKNLQPLWMQENLKKSNKQKGE